ncbi:hypothetical protein RYH80_07205 [Halobaculum sp. MBLA0147]|uniref:hypothetical protein n=1 Tax=Halobaculum sp. MBLA0147 TaxID=3079934 RepID=UPI0035269436
MPITRDEFRTLDDDTATEWTGDDRDERVAGRVYRFLLAHADSAFRRDEIVTALDDDAAAVADALDRLRRDGRLAHRGEFWSVADDEHARAAAGRLAAGRADDRDGGFAPDEIERWMEAAVDPVPAFASSSDTDSTSSGRTGATGETTEPGDTSTDESPTDP